MGENKSTAIEAIKKNLPSVKSAGRALIAGIPCVGGSLDHLIFDRAEELFMKNLEKSVAEMSERIAEMEEQKIDKGWFESEEALNLFGTLMDKVRYEQDKRKVQMLSQAYVKFGTVEHTADPNKFAVLETLAKLTNNQSLIFRAVNNVPVEEKTFDGEALSFTAKARWLSAILDYMKSDAYTKSHQQGGITLDLELDILVSFNLLANVDVSNSNDLGYRVTQLGKLAYSYMLDC